MLKNRFENWFDVWCDSHNSCYSRHPTNERSRSHTSEQRLSVSFLACVCLCVWAATVTWSIDRVHLRCVGWQVKSKGRLKGSPHFSTPRPCREGGTDLLKEQGHRHFLQEKNKVRNRAKSCGSPAAREGENLPPYHHSTTSPPSEEHASQALRLTRLVLPNTWRAATKGGKDAESKTRRICGDSAADMRATHHPARGHGGPGV